MLTKTEMQVRKTNRSRIAEIDWTSTSFGHIVSDHMLVCDYGQGAWQSPEILPYEDLRLPPATMALHYGQAIFEGMKAFRLPDGRVSIFRIERHYERLLRTLERMCMPALPFEVFSEGLQELVSLDAAWVPALPGWSLYIRPFMFATDSTFGAKVSDTYKYVVFTGPVGPYYAKPLKVKVEDRYIRAAPGGTGYAKCAGNYGGAMYPTQLARREGFDQVLWTDGSDALHIEESGTMNVAFVLDGVVVTPALSDTILDGVTRDSVLTLAGEMGYRVEERLLSAFELVDAHARGVLQEAFGVGTAAVTAPIDLIRVKGRDLQLPAVEKNAFALRARNMLEDIRTGLRPDLHGWNTVVTPGTES